MSNLVFAQFLCEKLDSERGRQTQLANDLQISKSTITAWRYGAKPDFISCLLLSEHFNVSPTRMLKMVGDEHYQMIYRRFFAGNRDNRISHPVTERDLYRNRTHAEVHRLLQLLLESESEEADAVATMIRTAANQVSDKASPADQASKPDSDSKAGAGIPRQSSSKRHKPD